MIAFNGIPSADMALRVLTGQPETRINDKHQRSFFDGLASLSMWSGDRNNNNDFERQREKETATVQARSNFDSAVAEAERKFGFIVQQIENDYISDTSPSKDATRQNRLSQAENERTKQLSTAMENLNTEISNIERM